MLQKITISNQGCSFEHLINLRILKNIKQVHKNIKQHNFFSKLVTSNK